VELLCDTDAKENALRGVNFFGRVAWKGWIGAGRELRLKVERWIVHLRPSDRVTAQAIARKNVIYSVDPNHGDRAITEAINVRG
jgi:hypothetical protein